MSTKQKRFILPEDEIPKYWYNIQADMKTKPMPHGLKFPKQCVKCTNTIAAHHWYVPTDWKKH